MEKTFIIPTNFIDKTCGEAARPSQLFVYHLKSSAFWGAFLVILANSENWNVALAPVAVE